MPKTCLNDCNYNVVKQLSKRLSFLWAVQGYTKDAKACGHTECVKMWEKIKKNDDESTKLLKEMLTKIAKAGKLK